MKIDLQTKPFTFTTADRSEYSGEQDPCRVLLFNVNTSFDFEKASFRRYYISFINDSGLLESAHVDWKEAEQLIEVGHWKNITPIELDDECCEALEKSQRGEATEIIFPLMAKLGINFV
jgi:hypothetical protein